MSHLEPFELEGRLNGLREVLEIVVRHLIADGDEDLRRALERRVSPADQQEDPGAVPEAAFAVEAAATREIHLILERVEARLAKP